jgi:release factor glutamine methyltransferase
MKPGSQGLKLYVDENVLIPRPETEELVEWIVSDLTIHNSQFTILDIGTGSGCIAIALKKKLPSSQLSALDISEAALKIAQRNASDHNTQINFFRADILHEEDIENLSRFDVIVSNPPYVKRNEAEDMRTNVFLYEPHVALFVPDEDALLFYRHIARFANSHLNENGCLYVEINELHAEDVADLFRASGFRSIEIKKDMQGKDRMIKATRG